MADTYNITLHSVLTEHIPRKLSPLYIGGTGKRKKNIVILQFSKDSLDFVKTLSNLY